VTLLSPVVAGLSPKFNQTFEIGNEMTKAKRGVTPKRRMTAIEFDALRPLLTVFSEDRCNAARAVLVDGKTLQSAATENGFATRQAVNGSVAAIWSIYEQYNESLRISAAAGTLLPPDWEKVTLIAPRHLIAEFRVKIAEAATEAAPTIKTED
jgi:hypothetical protein